MSLEHTHSIKRQRGHTGLFFRPKNLESNWVFYHTFGGLNSIQTSVRCVFLITSDFHSQALCTETLNCHVAYKPAKHPPPLNTWSFQKHLFPISAVWDRAHPLGSWLLKNWKPSLIWQCFCELHLPGRLALALSLSLTHVNFFCLFGWNDVIILLPNKENTCWAFIR